jgi:hypothetical protein
VDVRNTQLAKASFIDKVVDLQYVESRECEEEFGEFMAFVSVKKFLVGYAGRVSSKEKKALKKAAVYAYNGIWGQVCNSQFRTMAGTDIVEDMGIKHAKKSDRGLQTDSTRNVDNFNKKSFFYYNCILKVTHI